MESHMASADFLRVPKMKEGSFSDKELGYKIVKAELCKEELVGAVSHDFVVLTLEKPTSEGQFLRVDFGDQALGFRTHETEAKLHDKAYEIHTSVTFDVTKCEQRCYCHTLGGLADFLNHPALDTKYHLVENNCWTIGRSILFFLMGGQDGPALACIPKAEAERAYRKIEKLASGHKALQVMARTSSALAVKTLRVAAKGAVKSCKSFGS